VVIHTRSTNFVYNAIYKVSHTETIDLSNLFSYLMYNYKTSKSVPTMEETSKSFSSYGIKASNKVLMYAVKSSERWIIRNRKTRVCNRNGYTHIVLTLYTYATTNSSTIVKTYPTCLVISCITIRLASPSQPWKKCPEACGRRLGKNSSQVRNVGRRLYTRSTNF
jgi:hypothetical protein